MNERARKKSKQSNGLIEEIFDCYVYVNFRLFSEEQEEAIELLVVLIDKSLFFLVN